jgi:hypothetical protein
MCRLNFDESITVFELYHSAILQDKVPASTFKVLSDYHSTTVKLLALQAAATDDVSPLKQLPTYIFMILHWR